MMQAWRDKKWVGLVGAVAGVIGIATGAVVTAGTPIADTPVAMANPTTATPWAPRPHFWSKTAPQPQSSVDSQDTVKSRQNQGNQPANPDTGNQPANPSSSNGSSWVAQATPPFEDATQALTDLKESLNTDDTAAMKSACQALSSAGQSLAATLPSPKEELTSEIQQSVDEIGATSQACLSDPPDNDAVETHATQVKTHLSNIVEIVQAGQ